MQDFFAWQLKLFAIRQSILKPVEQNIISLYTKKNLYVFTNSQFLLVGQTQHLCAISQFMCTFWHGLHSKVYSCSIKFLFLLVWTKPGFIAMLHSYWLSYLLYLSKFCGYCVANISDSYADCVRFVAVDISI